MESELELTNTLQLKESEPVVNISDSDVEDGEISEANNAEYLEKVSCLYFQKGHCAWGKECRLLHLSDKGLYTMFDSNEKVRFSPVLDSQTVYGPHIPPVHSAQFPSVHGLQFPTAQVPSVNAQGSFLAPLTVEEPEKTSLVETEWDQNLKEALERVKKSNLIKEPSPPTEAKFYGTLEKEGDVVWCPKSPPIQLIYDSKLPSRKNSPPESFKSHKNQKAKTTDNLPKVFKSHVVKNYTQSAVLLKRSRSSSKKRLRHSSPSSRSPSADIIKERRSRSRRRSPSSCRCHRSRSSSSEEERYRRKRSREFDYCACAEDRNKRSRKFYYCGGSKDRNKGSRSPEHRCRRRNRSRRSRHRNRHCRHCCCSDSESSPIYITMYSSSSKRILPEKEPKTSRTSYSIKVRSPYELSLKKEILSRNKTSDEDRQLYKHFAKDDASELEKTCSSPLDPKGADCKTGNFANDDAPGLKKTCSSPLYPKGADCKTGNFAKDDAPGLEKTCSPFDPKGADSDMSISPLSEHTLSNEPILKTESSSPMKEFSKRTSGESLLDQGVLVERRTAKKDQPQRELSSYELLLQAVCSEKRTSSQSGVKVLPVKPADVGDEYQRQNLDPFQKELQEFKESTSFLMLPGINSNSKPSSNEKKGGGPKRVKKNRGSKLSMQEELKKQLAEVNAAISRKRMNIENTNLT